MILPAPRCAHRLTIGAARWQPLLESHFRHVKLRMRADSPSGAPSCVRGIAKEIEGQQDMRALVEHHTLGAARHRGIGRSAREGNPCLARDSSTCVAQITGTWAASQNQRISSWTSAILSKPISTPEIASCHHHGNPSLAHGRRGSFWKTIHSATVLDLEDDACTRRPRGRRVRG